MKKELGVSEEWKGIYDQDVLSASKRRVERDVAGVASRPGSGALLGPMILGYQPLPGLGSEAEVRDMSKTRS